MKIYLPASSPAVEKVSISAMLTSANTDSESWTFDDLENNFGIYHFIQYDKQGNLLSSKEISKEEYDELSKED